MITQQENIRGKHYRKTYKENSRKNKLKKKH